MTSLRQRLYVSTIADDGIELARQYGLGLELADFCAGMNLDPGEWHDRQLAALERGLAASDRFVLHAPFCELTPAAVDPLIGQVSRRRYEQAFALAWERGVRRLVVHSGFVPNVYFDSWFVERSVLFWRDFLADKPADFQLLIENVLDPQPEPLMQVIENIDDHRAALCLDLGHAAVYSSRPLTDWLQGFLPRLAHVHVHDNRGQADEHLPLGQGSLPLSQALDCLEQAAPSYTIENLHAAPSLLWLEEQGWL